MITVPIPSPFEIKKIFPVSLATQGYLSQMRKIAKKIVTGQDRRLACIIGPCSIHEKSSALEYGKRFKELAREVEETCFLVMRVYFEKPRTSNGWKGWLYDPHLNGSNDMHTGLLWTRELLLSLAELGIPIATEFVDTLAACYFEDLVTWGFIGARTSASQLHRQFASLLQIPIGFKNSTDGNLDDAMHGIAASAISHTFFSIDQEAKLCMSKSEGNPHTHLVLRGSYHAPNYDACSVAQAIHKLEKSKLRSRIMIDCAHGNCQKQCDRQQNVFHSVLEQLQQGNNAIFGCMLESHLESGFQPLSPDPALLKYAVSITDPCIDWVTTERLIHTAHQSLIDSISISIPHRS